MSKIDRIEKKTVNLQKKLGEAQKESYNFKGLLKNKPNCYYSVPEQKLLLKIQNKIEKLQDRIELLNSTSVKILKNQIESYR